jgi:hypothetical protein
MSVAFKATSSSKGKAKQDTSSEDDDSSFDDMDNEMALFVKRFGKFMVKKGYHARMKKSLSRTRKSQEGASSVEVRIILLLNAHTIATIMMMIRRAKRRTRRKRKRRRTR